MNDNLILRNYTQVHGWTWGRKNLACYRLRSFAVINSRWYLKRAYFFIESSVATLLVIDANNGNAFKCESLSLFTWLWLGSNRMTIISIRWAFSGFWSRNGDFHRCDVYTLIEEDNLNSINFICKSNYRTWCAQRERPTTLKWWKNGNKMSPTQSQLKF